MNALPARWRSSQYEYTYLHESDMPDVIAMLKKESVCRWMFFGPNTEKFTREYFDPMVASIGESLAKGERPRYHVFCIREIETGQFVGQCALIPVEFSEGAYLVGFQLDDHCWGKGIGTEACEFLVLLAFKHLTAYRLCGDCLAGNEASRRVMLGRGFREEGVRRQHWNKRGTMFDKENFGLLREEMDGTYLQEIEGRFLNN